MNPSLSIAVAGANGRLGQEICKAIVSAKDLELAFGLVRAKSEVANSFDVPFVENLSDQLAKYDVLIDVSVCSAVIGRLTNANKALVIGVTGFSAAQNEMISQAASKIPILQTGNFSLGVNLLLQLAEQAIAKLGPSSQVQIKETHHTGKQDHPSGTALMLADALMSGLGESLQISAALHPNKPASSKAGLLPITSYRIGNEIGQHSVIISNSHEEIVLGHSALKRSVFADGALIAARWLAAQKPGLYGMSDVLGN